MRDREEPYSLALLAFEAFAPEAPPVSILATDISSRALERAQEGVYRPRSTRELDPALHARYFRADDDLLVADAAFARSSPLPATTWSATPRRRSAKARST